MTDLDLDVAIHGKPNEIADAIPFAIDDVHDAYDADAAAKATSSSSARYASISRSARGPVAVGATGSVYVNGDAANVIYKLRPR